MGLLSCGPTKLSASKMSQKVQEEILRGKQQTFGDYVWNSETSQFLGRTGGSWAKIGIFYVIFYAFLAGFFSCMMAVFYTTLDTTHLPKYSPGNQDSILRNPALGFRPLPRKENVESTLIWYNTGNVQDIEHWVNSLNDFIEHLENISAYEGTGAQGESSDVKDCTEDSPAEEGQVCKFDYQLLGDKCTKAEDWGYARKSPCVILKMNKMIGWVPDVYTTIGEIEYKPWQGFPKHFFPYMHTPGYLPPIIAVRFVAPASNVLINVECKAYAKNIAHNRKERLGLVHFELLRD